MCVRKSTNKLIELAEEGYLSWEIIARSALNYLSEDEVTEMAEKNELFSEED